ncbi:PAS domain-containing protein [Pedobacter sp. KBS0701]|uniref:PAS domain-containing sensor histidine kinase n=1 Tax=Pedobacter sp. KBS0701 TaxID=2578106 RepID=UPI00110F31CD|nr:PAS domain-containing sensor histidine kinase [Pedobacter sp. KBS0701]QDW26298.1 PAS domain-containing protein [Pedobacter sp. KBS0701]
MRTSTNTSSFIALAPIPIFIIDPYSLKLEYANARFLDLVNGSLQEIEGLIINDILGQDLSLAISAFFLQLENASNNTSIPVQIPDIESNITPFSSYSYFASTFEEAHGTKLKIAVWLIAKTKVTTEPDISITSDQTLVKQESGKEVLSDMKPTEKRPNIEYVQAVGESQQIETDNLLISNGDIKKSESAEAQQALSETWIELETSREWFKNMVHSSPVAMLITKGEDMVFDVINNAMLNLIGRDSSVLGKPWFEAIPELVGQPVVDELFYAYRTGLAHHLPGVGISLIKNGESTLGYYDLTYTPLKENGKVIGLMQTATDITEYVTSKDKLQKAYEQIRLSKEAAQLGTFDMDMVTGRLQWDDRCRLLFGISHSDEVDFERDFLNNLHPEDVERINSILTHVFDKQASNGIYDVKYRTIGYEDKRLRWIRAKGQVYFDANDKPLRFIGSVLDITEQKEDEQRKNDFIGMASHELKTPLTSINGYLQLLQYHARLQSENRMLSTIDKSLNQVKRMTRMIDGFLNVSRLESGKIAIDKQQFEITNLLKEVCEETMTLTKGHRVNLHLNNEIMVNADQNKLSQVLQNLIGNAIKYSDLGSEVNIKYAIDNDHIIISIIDKGIGIKPEHQQKLFDRYYRVENDSTIAGFGIGLYLCAEIVTRHHGKIWVESEFGKGSTFSFSIPLSTAS